MLAVFMAFWLFIDDVIGTEAAPIRTKRLKRFLEDLLLGMAIVAGHISLFAAPVLKKISGDSVAAIDLITFVTNVSRA